jgi:hypothetical protein
MPSPKLAVSALRLAAHTTDTFAGSEYLTPPARSSTEVSMFVVEDGGVETSAAPNRYIAFRRRSSEVGQIVTNDCKASVASAAVPEAVRDYAPQLKQQSTRRASASSDVRGKKARPVIYVSQLCYQSVLLPNSHSTRGATSRS